MATRTTLLIVPATLLVLVAATHAQQSAPAPRPAPRGLTTSRTWTDDDLDKIMKQLGPAATNLAKLIADKEGPAAEAHADTVEYYLDEAEQFFDARNIADAEDLARQASSHADHVEDAVEAGDFAKAGEHLKLLMGTCESCHSKHRERAADGTYSLKKD